MLKLSKSIRFTNWNTLKDINPYYLEAQYAVRVVIPTMAASINPLEEITQLEIHQHLDKSQQHSIEMYKNKNFSFIQKRDGPLINDIILTDDASSGIILLFNLLLKKNGGVMKPLPQHPPYLQLQLYVVHNKFHTILQKQRISQQNNLNQNNHMKGQNKNKLIKPKMLVCINPGNPTGQVFERQSNVEMINQQNKLLQICCFKETNKFS